MHVLSPKQNLLLDTVSKFGIISGKQILRYLKGELIKPTLYKVKNQLMAMGLIGTEKVGLDTVFYITEKGASYTGDYTIGYTSFPITTLKHDLLVNECILTYLEIGEENSYITNIEFISDKTLLKQELEEAIFLSKQDEDKMVKKNSVRLRNRIPDFVLITTLNANGQEVKQYKAYEVELHAKSKNRYTDKFLHYKQLIKIEKRYRNVTYIVPDKIVYNAVARASTDTLTMNEDITLKMLQEVIKIEQ